MARYLCQRSSSFLPLIHNGDSSLAPIIMRLGIRQFSSDKSTCRCVDNYITPFFSPKSIESHHPSSHTTTAPPQEGQPLTEEEIPDPPSAFRMLGAMGLGAVGAVFIAGIGVVGMTKLAWYVASSANVNNNNSSGGGSKASPEPN